MPSTRRDALPGSSTLALWTCKEGLLSRVAHDLQFLAASWRAPVEVEGDAARIEVVVPVAGLRVQGQVRADGTVAALAPKDHREIEDNLGSAKVLGAARFPEIRWQGAAPLQALAPGSRARIEGRLSLRGVERPLPVEVAVAAGPDGGVVVSGEVRFLQTAFQVTPFSALFGALRVKDEVRVTWSIAYPRLL